MKQNKAGLFKASFGKNTHDLPCLVVPGRPHVRGSSGTTVLKASGAAICHTFTVHVLKLLLSETVGVGKTQTKMMTGTVRSETFAGALNRLFPGP